MKHPVLLTVIILCLVVFITALVSGVILTVATVGWQGLANLDQFPANVTQVVEQFRDWARGIHVGPWKSYTIDQTHTASLDGIDHIIIQVVSEQVSVSAQGQQVVARLHGPYRATVGLGFAVTRSGQTVRIKPDYPRWGFRNDGLSLDVSIPEDFDGTVTIKTVSGDCVITNPAGTDWSELDYTGVSGDLKADTADWSKMNVNIVSGTIDLASIIGKADLKTVSGKITAQYATLEPKALKVDTVSGKVELSFPEKARFDISFETISGDFDSKRLPVEVMSKINRVVEATRNGGGGNISVKTVSGPLVLLPAD